MVGALPCRRNTLVASSNIVKRNEFEHMCLQDASRCPGAPKCLMGSPRPFPRCLLVAPRSYVRDPEEFLAFPCPQRISFRICLDKSGLSIGPCHGHLLLPSWENRCQVGNGPKSRKNKVLRMAFSIVENVPTARESIFELCPVSQRPYRAKKTKMD